MTLRQFFTRMAPKTFRKIAEECHQGSATDQVGAMIQWCKDHTVKIADLKSRYPELKTDKGLMN